MTARVTEPGWPRLTADELRCVGRLAAVVNAGGAEERELVVNRQDVVSVLGALRRVATSDAPVERVTVHIEHNAGSIIGAAAPAVPSSGRRRRTWWRR